MKILKIILVTFLISFATSALYELKFIALNPVRYVLTILLILIELGAGFYYIKIEVKKINQK